MKYKKRRRTGKRIKIEKKLAVVAILITLIVAFIVLGISYLNSEKDETASEFANELVIESEEKEIDSLEAIEKLISSEDRQKIELYDSYLKYDNGSYKGVVQFESGLIEEPFVQGVDNDMYLRRDWISGEYAVMGSIFMDYECNLNSQNIILYGHNAFSSWYAGKDENGVDLVNDELMFTPLKLLTKQDNYESNKYVNVILENEVRRYEIVSVYYCTLSGEGDLLYPDERLQYYLPEYSNDYFETYKSRIKDVEFYDTNIEFTNYDKYLTLQTCVEGNSMAREIVLCKELEVRSLDRKAYEEYATRLEAYNKWLEDNK